MASLTAVSKPMCGQRLHEKSLARSSLTAAQGPQVPTLRHISCAGHASKPPSEAWLDAWSRESSRI